MSREEMIEKVNKELLKEEIDTLSIFNLIKSCECITFPLHNELTVMRSACEIFNVRVEDLISTSRLRSIANARMFISKYLYGLGVYTLEMIGDILNRDHTTIIYLKKRASELIQFDKQMKSKWDEFLSIINDNALVA